MGWRRAPRVVQAKGVVRELNFQQRSTSKSGSSSTGSLIWSASTVKLIRSCFLISLARWKPYSFSLSVLGGNAVTKQTFIGPIR